jgi:competence transcription factor ComK
MRILILGAEISKYTPPSYSQTEVDMCAWLMINLIDEVGAAKYDEKKIKKLFN